MRNATLDSLFVTIVRLPEEGLTPARKLCAKIGEEDESFKWEVRKIDGEWVLLVYSASKNQARLRGEWLTTQTLDLRGLDYQVTHRLALETALRERPKEVIGLRKYLKRQRQGE